MREITQSLHRKIKARLFLNAVLPAFEDLLHYSERAQSILFSRDFSLRFQTSSGLKAVGNRIDVMAAIGLGDIQVTGLIPLADALGYIFERIPLYIEP